MPGNYFRPMSLGQLAFLLNYLNTFCSSSFTRKKKHKTFDPSSLIVALFTFIHYVNFIWSVSAMPRCLYYYHHHICTVHTLYHTHAHTRTHKHRERLYVDQQKHTHCWHCANLLFFLIIAKRKNDVYNLVKTFPLLRTHRWHSKSKFGITC